MRISKSFSAVFVIAFAARVGAQFVLGAFAQAETWEYETIANNLLAGLGYTYFSGGTTYVAAVSSPLYVLLTAGAYLVTNHSQAAMLLLQALFGAATAVLAAWLAARTFGRETSWAAGGLVAIDPALTIYAAKLHPLSLDALAFLAVLCAAVALPDRPRVRRLAWVGALVGLVALTRTTVLSFVPVFLLWSSRYRALRLLSPAALVFLVFAAVVYAPWPIRNSLLLGQFVPGSSESTEWVWRGTNAAATGSSLTADGRTMLEVASPEFRSQIATASEAQRIDLYRAATADFVRAHPAQTLGLYVAKLKGFWWGSDTTGLLYPSTWTILYSVWYATVLLLAALGTWWTWRQPSARPTIVLILASLLLVSLSQATFYVEGRHRLAVEPLLLVLSGAGLSRLATDTRLPSWSARRLRDVEYPSS